jgi:hypothetical protein
MLGINIKHFFSSFFIFASLAGNIFARDIQIYVEDGELSLPLEGALLRVQAPPSEGSSNANGEATIKIPDDKNVVIIVSFPGYESKRLVTNNNTSRYNVSMRMEGMLSNEELVFTAERTGDTQVETGRSVSIASKELARVAEIGLLEDVMTAVKLLPGVGYSGMFNAMPSIRGGDPGDMVAALDGFYIETPYFWGGSVSIFDPRMIESVKLSHGIFSARYGHTISGLLELTSKKPSPTEFEIELGISTSAVNLNVAVPFKNRGGLMIMGKATYWDGYLALVKALSHSVVELEAIRAVNIAPYIRTAAFSGDYRFNNALELTFNGFIGVDGVGAKYDNKFDIEGLLNHVTLDFLWEHIQGFTIAGLTWNPNNTMVIKSTIGGGFETNNIDGNIAYDLNLKNPADFIAEWRAKLAIPIQAGLIEVPDNYAIGDSLKMLNKNTTYSAQALVNYDWEMGHGFIFSAGVHELYSNWTRNQGFSGIYDIPVDDLFGQLMPGVSGIINRNVNISIKGYNQAFTSSAFSLVEYKTPDSRFGTELGLRVDHLYFIGEDFSISAIPAFNPRVNFNFNILKSKGIFDSFDVTAGTGFFSSITDNIQNLQSGNGIKDFEMPQNRSWTSLLGTKLTFLQDYSFNIEGYYKNVFDKAYTYNVIDEGNRYSKYRFDGQMKIWGFDLMIQKTFGRFFDGWISYTYNWARFKNPILSTRVGEVFEGDWRWPNYHRFHNLNLVLNIKPQKRFNIAARLGFASGVPLTLAGPINQTLVVMMRDNKTSQLIQEYTREMYYDDERRDGFTLPLDLKFSFYTFNKNGKTQGEIYLAIENLLGGLKTKNSNTSFDSYTGEEIQGSDTANYQMPIPMISFGFTWTY